MAERGFIASPGVNSAGLDKRNYDVIIIGAGIAGMTVALSLDQKLNIALVAKDDIQKSSTYKAQGGMAIPLGADDSPEEHIADTLQVGRGLCCGPAVERTIRDAPAALHFLQSLGVRFNRSENGLCLGKEAGHSHHRIIHYYDWTGRHIAETMAGKIKMAENITLLEHCFLVELLTHNQQCYGCLVLTDGEFLLLKGQAVVVATGGYSGLFARSTNSVSAKGDGIAAAYRAGAEIADMEFVQFHPTAFAVSSGEIFLLTEALRGEGAVLRNEEGERFMVSYHKDGELAPRDEVARAIVTEMEAGGQVYLDASHLGKSFLKDRFRQVYSGLVKHGYHLERDPIPVAPAAHYSIGGIATDLWGRATVEHLFACGEAAATGVHGANRLASNSLLEGVVFGRRVAEAIEGSFSVGKQMYPRGETMLDGGRRDYRCGTRKLGTLLTKAAGVVRNGEQMRASLAMLGEQSEDSGAPRKKLEEYCRYNACQLAELLLEAALLRCESRGTHYREDYPERKDEDFSRHVIQQWGKRSVLK